MSTLFVGLDLGGSGTRAALVDADGTLLASGRGRTGLLGGAASKPVAGRRHLARALDAALAPIRARVGGQPCVVYAGTRGLSVRGRGESLALELTQRFPSGDVHVTNDARIGFWGGLAGESGVAVVAGAGSIALARDVDGREGRAGGWGYLLGDEGSGYWLGREALLHHLGYLQRRVPAGVLTSLVAGVVQTTAVVDVLRWFYDGQDQVERLASLAPLVSRAAQDGDAAAMGILSRAGSALADIAAAAAKQVWPDADHRRVAVVCSGGVWAAGEALESAFATRLPEVLTEAERRPPRLPPVGGAVLLAMGAERRRLSADVVQCLAEGLRRV